MMRGKCGSDRRCKQPQRSSRLVLVRGDDQAPLRPQTPGHRTHTSRPLPCPLETVRIMLTLRTVITTPRLIPMAKSARKPTPSTIVNRTVPRRALNSDVRPREYLTEKEIERLQETARKRSRYGHRDATMILIAYRHGLRASELCGLRWDQIDLNSGRLHVRRAKGGIDNVHPLSGREIRACVSYAGKI
jgi:integrase